MRILLISPWNPWPIDSGSRQRAALIIEGLAVSHTVFVCHGLQESHPIPCLRNLPRNVEQWMAFDWPRGCNPLQKPRPNNHNAKLYPDLRPRDIQKMAPFIPDIKAVFTTFKPDVILALEADGALITTQLTGVPVVVDQWEPTRITSARCITRLRSQLFWWQTMRNITAITVVSPAEEEAAPRVIGKKVPIFVASNEVCVPEGYTHEPQENHILFVGNLDYAPNRSALLWFATDVLPTIQQMIPRAHIQVVGSGTPIESLLLCPGIVFCGRIDDIASAYKSAHIVINPVRTGHGSRVKVAEARAYSVPVVSFAVGVEPYPSDTGLTVVQDHAACALDFARAVLAILNRGAESAIQQDIFSVQSRPENTKLVKTLAGILDTAVSQKTESLCF